MRKPNYFSLKNVAAGIGLFIVILLFSPSVIAHNKVVVVPLFGDDSAAQLYSLPDYRAPVGSERIFRVKTLSEEPYEYVLQVDQIENGSTWIFSGGNFVKYFNDRMESYDPSGTLTQTCLYDPNYVKDLPDESKHIGESWGGVYIRTCEGGVGRVNPLMYTLLGIEDVTVPAGTFSNCLKIMRYRGSHAGPSIHWYAQGLGWIKRMYEGSMSIQHDGNATISDGQIYELTSYSSQPD